MNGRLVFPGMSLVLASFIALQPGAASASCSCPPGTTYSAAAGRCQASFNACLPGYAYDPATNRCEVSAPATTSSATCPGGSSFSVWSGKCEAANLAPCPSGYTYNSSTSKCEIAATLTPAASCPTGYAFDAASNRCVGGASSACLQFGGTWGNYEQTCTSGAALPGFNWDTETGQYVGPWYCPPAYALNTSNGSCAGPMVTASCPAGTTINAYTTKCEATASAACAAGQTYNPSNAKCDFPPLIGAAASVCPPSYTLVADVNTCAGTVNSACPAGSGFGHYEQACTSGSALPGFSWDTETLQYVGPWSCPAGFALDAGPGSCSGAPCPAGQVYDAATSACAAPAPAVATTLVCPTGSVFGVWNGKCEAANLGPCPSGYTYNSSTNKCEIAATLTPAASCPTGYAFDAASNRCAGGASSACLQFGGTWGNYEQTCTSGAALPGFSWDTETGQYVGPWYCPPAYALNTSNGSCAGPMVTASCPAGTTINAYTTKCEATASAACAAGQTYNPSNAKCDFPPVASAAAPTCPPGFILDVDGRFCAGALNSACPAGSGFGHYEQACTSGSALPGFTWDTETLQYVGPWSCPAGFALDAGPGSCSGAPCPSGAAFDAATSSCQLSGCPDGTVKSGSLCIAAAVCQ
ncbi:hypothetical protein [Anaeromyxobacter diazotrophicus]|uniref:Uncharacterized protein n=1 Tax=Anaeromyxobacter diazotrophicus TaxID=2590199 RepID=A0A7I9VK42_9BACT|nr:hypothetical protein [Anaeromyxobacter diazotrophicus]GEJ56558.1 hypothetical protein AMYX_12990 [Anaeromyxobacter diazotrophicus]